MVYNAYIFESVITPLWSYLDVPYLRALETLHFYFLTNNSELVRQFPLQFELAKKILRLENYAANMQDLQRFFVDIGYRISSYVQQDNCIFLLLKRNPNEREVIYLFPSLSSATIPYSDEEVLAANKIISSFPDIFNRIRDSRWYVFFQNASPVFTKKRFNTSNFNIY